MEADEMTIQVVAHDMNSGQGMPSVKYLLPSRVVYYRETSKLPSRTITLSCLLSFSLDTGTSCVSVSRCGRGRGVEPKVYIYILDYYLSN